MKKLIITLATLAMALTAQAKPYDAEYWAHFNFEEAQRRQKQGNYEDAVTFYKRVIEGLPGSILAKRAQNELDTRPELLRVQAGDTWTNRVIAGLLAERNKTSQSKKSHNKTSTTHTDNKPKFAECGEPPADAETVARRYLLEEALKDPDSAKIIFIKVEPSTRSRKDDPCWYVRFKVNARNSFGGYTGWQPVLVYINSNGKVDHVY